MKGPDRDEGILDALDDFESKVLELDRLARRGEDFRAFVHVLFRLAHNLKSSFSAAGLEGAVALLHSCESCLDALRSGGGAPGDSVADLLVAAIDALRGGTDSTELRLALDREAIALRSPGRSPNGIPFALDERELEGLEAATSSGASVYRLEKLVGAGMDEAAIAGLPVLETIAGAGRLIAHRIRRTDDAGGEAVLVILFASAEGLEELRSILFDPLFPVEPGPALERAPRRERAVASASLPHILLVEDEALPLVLLQKALVDYGRIDSASSGEEALDRFKVALGSAPYSVVFLDIMLPGKKGTEVLREMRELERAAGLRTGEGARIVMSSALRDFETVSLSFREQCELYLIKPIDAGKVREAMSKLGISPI